MTDSEFCIAINFIEQCFDKNILVDDEWNQLKHYSCDSHCDVKYRLCELLALFHCNQSEEILLSMLTDDDSIIRASACDSLSFSKSLKTIDILINLLNDNNKMVRGYAALSIGDIQNKIDVNCVKTISILKARYKKERSKWTKIAIARSLILLNEYSYISDIFDAINNRYYIIRNFALNLIIELIESYRVAIDLNFLLAILYKRNETESANCVKDSIQKLITLIQSHQSNNQGTVL